MVSDSLAADGRFLLYTFVSQVFPANGNNINKGNTDAVRILWLACGPVSEGQIWQGLKKIGCDKRVLSQAALTSDAVFGPRIQQQQGEPTSPLTICSVMSDVSTRFLGKGPPQDNMNDNNNFKPEYFVKKLYRTIETWVQRGNKHKRNYWIILDDVSTLANLLGERLVFNLILALNAKRNKQRLQQQHHQSIGLLLRCSNDSEAENMPTLAGLSVATNAPQWFGAGSGSTTNPQPQTHRYPNRNHRHWERSLVELADGVMDVVPLTTGYTRELHGKLATTQMPHGRGWGNPQSHLRPSSSASREPPLPPVQSINYCIADQKIVTYKTH